MNNQKSPGGIFLVILGLIVLIVLSFAIIPSKRIILRIGLASIVLIYLIYQTVSKQKNKKDPKHDEKS